MPPAPTKITGLLSSVSPQRQQYKPYAYNITFDNVYVELEISAEGVEKKGDKIVLNLEGFKSVLDQLSDAVDEIHDAYVIAARKGGKF